MKYLRQSKLFAIIVIIIAIGIMLSLYSRIDFLLYPIRAMFSSLFPIILISGFLYYIFLPVYELLKKKIDHDGIVIPIIFGLIIFVIYFMISSILPQVIDQLSTLISITPSVVNNSVSFIEDFMIENNISSGEVYNYVSNLDLSITNVLTNILDQFSTGFANVLSATLSSLVIIATVPLVVFYLFKEGNKLPKILLKFTPPKYKELAENLMSAFHLNARNYIGGRILVCFFVGLLSYVVFLLLGIPNALLFGLICGIADIIPYFGPFIGAAPSFFVALSISPGLALGVVIFIFILQQIESYVFTPFVMGNSLELHPVTVVVLVIFAKDAFGVIGMVLILPAYAIIKGCIIEIVHYLRDVKEIKFKYD